MTPFKGPNRVTSPFGPRTSPITGKAETHRGQDITNPNGDWIVRECTGGTVLRVNYDAARGKYVDVQTVPGTFERYQHMDTIAVSVGQKLKQGDTIGIAGNTGSVSGTARADNGYMGGRHLHFGVYRGGVAEANAISPQQWSDVPNAVGTYPGNSNLDGEVTPPPATANKLYEFSGIVASKGDADAIESLLNEKEINYKKEEVK